MSISWRRSISWFVVGVMVGAIPAMAATPKQVDEAIEKAKAFLYLRQNFRGDWETVPNPQVNLTEGEHSIHIGQYGGVSALCTYALLAARENHQEPRLVKAIKFLEQCRMIGVYAVAMRCNVWATLPPARVNKALLRQDAHSLLNATYPAGPGHGFYSYLLEPRHSGSRFDHSCSQMAVLGLWSAAQAGEETPLAYWSLVENGWRANQFNTGGWLYSPTDNLHQPEFATVTMTAAGLATLFITQDYVHRNEGVKCSGNINDPWLERGRTWMAGNIDRFSYENPSEKFPMRTYYALYGIERVGVAGGYKYFGSVDWYKMAADFLISKQAADGSWGEDGAYGDGVINPYQVYNTAMSLLVLVRGRAPVVMSKLVYPIDANGDKPVPANWNERPRDVASFTRWLGRQLERDLNWQIVEIEKPLEELHDAPILYISGNQALNFSRPQVEKLRQYIEEGGLILGNADCGNAKFTESFRQLGSKLFPSYEFRELPADHAIYKEAYLRSSMKTPPSVLGLSNGSRELMILFPQADPARNWQMQQVLGKEPLYQIPADVFLYAVDKKNLYNKGESHLIKADPNIAAKGLIKIARLQAGGNWNPEPGGWRRLSNQFHNTRQMDLVMTAVKPGEGKLDNTYPLAHLTGTIALKLSDAARAEIRQYVQGGGTLLIDAAGGSSEFAASVEAELAVLFPEEAKAMAVLEPAAAVYQFGGIHVKEIEYREYSRKKLGAAKGPQLRGIQIKDRVAVIYSREDLSTGLVGEPVDGVYGYTPKSAMELVSGVLLYATERAGGEAVPKVQ